MAGARWVQNEILEEIDDSDLVVYAVWYDMFPGDSKQRWPHSLLDDPRIHHYWDEQRLLGKWYGEHPDYLDTPGRVYWDAYILYGPDTVWESAPNGVLSWGGTIVENRQNIKKQVSRALSSLNR